LLFVVQPVRRFVADLLGYPVAMALTPHADTIDEGGGQDRDQNDVDEEPHPSAIIVHNLLLASTVLVLRKTNARPMVWFKRQQGVGREARGRRGGDRGDKV
jgi:hypothetical protein